MDEIKLKAQKFDQIVEKVEGRLEGVCVKKLSARRKIFLKRIPINCSNGYNSCKRTRCTIFDDEIIILRKDDKP